MDDGRETRASADRRSFGNVLSILGVEALVVVGVMVIVGFVVMLVVPCIVAASVDLDEKDAN